MAHTALPVGGRIGTPLFKIAAFFAALGFVLLSWRYIFGIGAVTAMNDGYAWGIWIAFDVVIGTAIACGGYTMALLVYILNRGRYHPLVRSALLTSALGYTMAGIAVIADLGRWWNIFAVPLKFWEWNLNSILLEVALCMMLYTAVVWIELSPAIFERGRTASHPRLRAISEFALPRVNTALPWRIAFGLVLPTLHQSSLGSLMMLAGPRLHALWQSPLLPLMFLLSCVGIGLASVVLESTLSSRSFGRKDETPLLARLARPAAMVMLLYAAIRIADLAWRGSLGLLLELDRYALLFMLEMALVIVPAFMLLDRVRVLRTPYLFRAAALTLAGGALYRFSTFLFAFDPGAGWAYFPAVAEMLITVGILAAEMVIYIAAVNIFPILNGTRVTPPGVRRVPVPAGVQLPSGSQQVAGD
jgi:Ni/Fe-hydrogenase subunit HybB-like protein